MNKFVRIIIGCLVIASNAHAVSTNQNYLEECLRTVKKVELDIFKLKGLSSHLFESPPLDLAHNMMDEISKWSYFQADRENSSQRCSKGKDWVSIQEFLSRSKKKACSTAFVSNTLSHLEKLQLEVNTERAKGFLKAAEKIFQNIGQDCKLDMESSVLLGKSLIEFNNQLNNVVSELTNAKRLLIALIEISIKDSTSALSNLPQNLLDEVIELRNALAAA